MKFYGTGIVWNPDKEKALCQFVKGELDTEDAEIINKLIELGYKHEETERIGAIEITSFGDSEPKYIDKIVNLEEKTDIELKALAKEKGIKGFGIMKHDKLIEKLREV